MRTHHLLLAMSMVATPAALAAAQGTARFGAIPLTGMPGAPDPVRVSARLAVADSLVYSGKLHEAQVRYRELVEELRASGQYPRDALWHLATSYLYTNPSGEVAAPDAGEVAGIMDELSAAAAKFGDPTTELNATFEAAALYQGMHMSVRAAQRLDRVKELLQSPAISDGAKRQVEGRIASGH
jgi:hypothetical protein